MRKKAAALTLLTVGAFALAGCNYSHYSVGYRYRSSPRCDTSGYGYGYGSGHGYGYGSYGYSYGRRGHGYRGHRGGHGRRCD